MSKYILSVAVAVLFAHTAIAAPIVPVSYVYNTGFQPDTSYPDNTYHAGNLSGTPTELTDGVIGTASFLDTAWVGFEDLTGDGDDVGVYQPSITFNLGGLYELSSTTIHYLVDHPVGQIFAADSVDVTFSTDGVNYSPTPITFTGFNDPNTAISVQSSTFSLGANVAQFVRMNFLNDGHWHFVSEIQFAGDTYVPPPVPEPSSIVLLGLGSLALRRKTVKRVG